MAVCLHPEVVLLFRFLDDHCDYSRCCRKLTPEIIGYLTKSKCIVYVTFSRKHVINFIKFKNCVGYELYLYLFCSRQQIQKYI